MFKHAFSFTFLVDLPLKSGTGSKITQWRQLGGIGPDQYTTILYTYLSKMTSESIYNKIFYIILIGFTILYILSDKNMNFITFYEFYFKHAAKATS